jgi:hypothetical protein
MMELKLSEWLEGLADAFESSGSTGFVSDLRCRAKQAETFEKFWSGEEGPEQMKTKRELRRCQAELLEMESELLAMERHRSTQE